MEKIINNLNTIFNHFGESAQYDKLLEECSELIESPQIGSEEVADVFVVSAQIVLNDPAMLRTAKEKIARTLNRIESGYYDEVSR